MQKFLFLKNSLGLSMKGFSKDCGTLNVVHVCNGGSGVIQNLWPCYHTACLSSVLLFALQTLPAVYFQTHAHVPSLWFSWIMEQITLIHSLHIAARFLSLFLIFLSLIRHKVKESESLLSSYSILENDTQILMDFHLMPFPCILVLVVVKFLFTFTNILKVNSSMFIQFGLLLVENIFYVLCYFFLKRHWMH